MTQRLLNRNPIACKQKKIIKALLACLIVPFLLGTFFFSTVKAAPAKLLTKFPFTMLTGGIIIVEARVAHFADTLNFVLDTGSGGISLDSTTVSNLKLPVTKTNRTIRGIAGIRNVDFVMNQTLLLPKLLVDSLNFHINDYALLTSVYGMKIDGIIGYSFFRRYIVKINYDDLTLEIWEPGEIKNPKAGLMLRPSINNIPVIKGAITDNTEVESKFYFDTGAGLCLLMSEYFAKDSSILKKGKKITLTQAEGIGGKKPMKITTVKSVQVGQYKFRKVPAYIFDDEFNVTTYPLLGGLIGNDLFRRFNLIINYGKGYIHLLPNTHYSDPFDYSYTGLGLYMVDGQIVVEDVIEGSPAEKAGFLTGDVILSVGTNFTNNILAYKALLQIAGARLKIVVTRNHELIVLNLKVASIL